MQEEKIRLEHSLWMKVRKALKDSRVSAKGRVGRSDGGF